MKTDDVLAIVADRLEMLENEMVGNGVKKIAEIRGFINMNLPPIEPEPDQNTWDIVDKWRKRFINKEIDDMEEMMWGVVKDINAQRLPASPSLVGLYTKDDLMMIQTKLVSLMPTGETTAWDFVLAIKKFQIWLDQYMKGEET